jgi:hypothetical protein
MCSACSECSFEVVTGSANYQSLYMNRSPLWSSGHSFWLLTQRSRFRFPAVPNFLSSSGWGTRSTEPREDK